MMDVPVWGFRVSSRPEAGAGHLSRCLSLADALGGDVMMFLDPTGPDPAFAGRLTMQCRREAAPERCDELLAALRGKEIQAAVTDSYALDEMAISGLADIVFTVSIEDTQDIVSSHLSIRPGLAAKSAPKGTQGARILGGGEYALLDKAFAAAPARRTGAQPHLLINFGARDSKNATGAVLAALSDEFLKMDRITVVLGESAPHRAALVARHAGSAGVSFISPLSAPEMRALCDEHDLCIGAGGVGLLERMAAGLPTIVFSIADNQDSNAAAAVSAGTAVAGGSLRDFEPNSFRKLVMQTLSDAGLLSRVAGKARELVDGRGCERAAAAMQADYQAWRGRHVSL